ncbi:MAG: Restriction endonuclease BglII [Candidatus Scalindua rubra]|uniref:Restriction endonuclease BglII n=1 Tax=Candidatus Scalindua rubra TaxID=1872076 RepID=A0A1E3XBI1_9BACT|nr:MAG: Restriction endonuclease BglII [Candidatus Scalindua rubra]
MKIIEKYSHIYSEEYLIVHHKETYKEILDIVESVDVKKSQKRYNPKELDKEFNKVFRQREWKSLRYPYYVTTNYFDVQRLTALTLKRQKDFLTKHGIESPIYSYKQTDFVKDNIAVEVQFGKYSFVAYDLFVKHLLFYTGGVINVGIEVLPMKSMQAEMSTGIAYYEGEVYNVLRHGRNNPPVPLLIIGVAP